MSSFRWGMIASSTPTNSQVTVWELRHLLFSSLSSIVLLTVLYTDIHLGYAYVPPHFVLSFCNTLEEINPPYPIWKGTSLAFIWGIVACPAPRGCRDMAQRKDPPDRPSYCTTCYQNTKPLDIKYFSLIILSEAKIDLWDSDMRNIRRIILVTLKEKKKRSPD